MSPLHLLNIVIFFVRPFLISVYTGSEPETSVLSTKNGSSSGREVGSSVQCVSLMSTGGSCFISYVNPSCVKSILVFSAGLCTAWIATGDPLSLKGLPRIVSVDWTTHLLNIIKLRLNLVPKSENGSLKKCSMRSKTLFNLLTVSALFVTLKPPLPDYLLTSKLEQRLDVRMVWRMRTDSGRRETKMCPIISLERPYGKLAWQYRCYRPRPNVIWLTHAVCWQHPIHNSMLYFNLLLELSFPLAAGNPMRSDNLPILLFGQSQGRHLRWQMSAWY